MFRSILSDRTFAPITLLPSGYSRLMGCDESGIRLCSATHLIMNCSSLILRSWQRHCPVSGCPHAFMHGSRQDQRVRFTCEHSQNRGSRMSVNRLPSVGRIRAVHLPQGGPRVPKSLSIEYSDRNNATKWYQLEVPFVDAMHLLALLQGAKDDVGYKEPVEAPAPEKD